MPSAWYKVDIIYSINKVAEYTETHTTAFALNEDERIKITIAAIDSSAPSP